MISTALPAGLDLGQARAWCEDVFSDLPTDASDAEIVAAVARSYVGGLAQFVRDGE